MGSKPITAKAAAKVYANSVAKQTKPGVDLQKTTATLYGSGKTRMIDIPGVTTTSSRGKTWDDLRAEGWSEEQINEAKAWREKNPDAPREQITETSTAPGTTKEIKTPGWEGTLMEETRGTVMQPWEIRQQSRADKKIARDQFRSNIKDGMSRKDAKAARNKFLKQLSDARAEQQAFSAGSGQLAGGTFRTGQRAMLQGQLSKSEQREMLAARNEAEQARATNPYNFNGTRGESIGTPKREQVIIADTGLAGSTPDASRLMRGTNPLEEKQPGIAKSRGYKMGGYGSKNKK
jgi:hypothetical protein